MNLSETTTHGITCTCGETFPTPDQLEDHVAAHCWQPNPEDHETRQPTDTELETLIQWYQDTLGTSRKEAVDTINQCTYIVIDNYATGCPGYTGRVLIEIGSAGPSYYAVYIWHEGDLQRLNQADEVRHTTGDA